MNAYQKRRLRWLLAQRFLSDDQKRELAFLQRVVDTEAKMRPGPDENKMMTPGENK